VLLDQYATNPNARLAVDVFCYRLKKYVGSYDAALGGVDVLVFTGGIGENAGFVREKTCEGLEFLGIRIDSKRNKEGSGKEALISLDGDTAKVFVVPTDEELVIAEETVRLVKPAVAN
jgi:acetate kinase